MIKSKPVKRQDFPAQTPVRSFRGPAFVLLPTLDQPALREREILRRNQLPVGGLAMMNVFLIIFFGVLGREHIVIVVLLH